MNQFGSQALRHWEQHRTTALRALEDQEQFFTELGEEIAQRVDALCTAMESAARSELNAMEYLTAVGRLNAIKMSAVEVAMQEMVYSLPMETPLSTATAEDLEAQAAAVGGTIIEGRLVPRDPTHPWRELYRQFQEGEVEKGQVTMLRAELDWWLDETPQRQALGLLLEELALAE